MELVCGTHLLALSGVGDAKKKGGGRGASLLTQAPFPIAKRKHKKSTGGGIIENLPLFPIAKRKHKNR